MSLKRDNVTELTHRAIPLKFQGRDNYVDLNAGSRNAVVQILLDCIKSQFLEFDTIDQIWRAELSYRSQSLLQLLMLGRRQTPRNGQESNLLALECGQAQKLIKAYHSLNTGRDSEYLSCEEIVQLIVQGLISTFRNTIGIVELAMYTRPISISGRRRRALALLIGQMVIDLLLDKSRRNVDARLALSFSKDERGQISIKIETSCAMSSSLQEPGYGIVCALAGVIGGEILFSEARFRETNVELILPLNECFGEIQEMIISN